MPLPRFSTRMAALLVATAILLTTIGLIDRGSVPPAGAAPTTGATVAAQTRPTDQPAAVTPDNVNAWLDGLVPAYLDTGQIPGATVVVVKDGRVVTQRGYGTVDRWNRHQPGATPVDPEQHLFRVASISKTITATAIMQQVERGTIDLDADVQRYLDFPLATPKGAVTMRHLMTHTAGFEDRYAGIIETSPLPPLRERMATDQPAQIFTPGTTPAYSNYGANLAGYVLERVTGRPFAEYLRTEVLEPLHMTSTTYVQPLPPGLADRQAGAFKLRKDTPEPFEYADEPSGSVTTSAADMARFMNFQLGHGPAGILRPGTLQQMQRPAFGPDGMGGINAGDSAMGLLWPIGSVRGHRTLRHDGALLTSFASVTLFPDDNAGVFIAINGQGNSSANPTNAIGPAFVEQFLAPAAPPMPAPQPTAREHGRAMEGRYRYSRRMDSGMGRVGRLAGVAPEAKVTLEPDGALLLTGAYPDPARYVEVRPWVWQQVDGDDWLTARHDGGKVTVIATSSAAAFTRSGWWTSNTFVAVVFLVAFAVTLGAAVTGGRRWWRHRQARGSGVDVEVEPLTGALRLAGWGAWAMVAAVAIMATTFALDLLHPSFPALRAAQILALLGVAGGVGSLLSSRHAPGWAAVIGRVAAGLAVLAVVAVLVHYRLLWPTLRF